MPALDFPSSPTLNQVYTANGKSWRWNGASWVANNSLSDTDVTTALGYTPVNKAGDTLSGNLQFAGNKAQRPQVEALRETVVVASIGTATYTFDLTASNVWDLTMTGNPTLAFSNPPASGILQSITVLLRQGTPGNRTVTYPGSVKWTDGNAPVLATATDKVDVLTFFTVDGGATYYGAHALANL
jgi:hypothetical protein